MIGLFCHRSGLRRFLRHPWLAGNVVLFGAAAAVGQVTNSVTWVDFPDAGLSNAVHVALGLPPGRLTSTNVLGLTNLVAAARGITNLEGLESALNLKQLYIEGNQVSDLSVLSGLTNLSALNAGDNLITNAGALAGLSNLRGLWLYGNSITNLSFLQSLTNLTVLSLVNDPLTDFSTLPAMTNLSSLALGDSAISNLAGLSGWGGLTNLAIVGSGLTNVAFLTSLTQLKILDLDNNRLSDATPLTTLGGLTDLDLDQNQITNASVLAGLTNLTSLKLLSNGVSDLSFLSGLKGLRILGLDDNKLVDVSPLASLTNLTYLSLENNRLATGPALSSNEWALSQLPNLVTLNLGGNLISDLGFLSGLSASNNLLNVSLAHNVITNITPLHSLVGLRGLDLGDNRLADVSVLTNLSKLAWVNLQWNLLNTNTGTAFGAVLQKLTGRGAVYYQPQHQPPRLSFNSGPPSLLTLGRWGIAGAATSSVAFVSWTDGNSGGISQISATSSNPGLVPSSNIVVTATQSGWTLAVTPAAGVTNGANPVSLTVTATDGLGQTTNLSLQVTVINPQPVMVPDPNLEAAIRKALNKPAGALSNLDLFGLSYLSAFDADINILSGLEWASNLICLDVGGNSITDLSPLHGLAQLKSLLVYENLVADLSPLVGMSNLDYVDLRWNWFTNLNLLQQLTNETALFLGGNTVSNLNYFTNLSRLALLDLDHCSIGNLSGLSALHNLIALDVSYNPLTNVIPVGAMRSLTNLHLNGCGLSDLAVLTNLNLSLLACYSNNVADLSPLVRLTNLNVLNAGHNPLSSSAPLCALTNLQAVQLSDVVLDGLAWWQCLPALRHLDLGNDGLNDTTAVAGLTNLQSLSLAGNPLTNLAGLSFLTNLVHLNLDRALNSRIGGEVTRDLSAVQSLGGLNFLSLSQNQLTNISGLTNLILLQEVDVRTNLLDLGLGSGALSVIENLTNRSVKVRYQPQDQPPGFTLNGWPPTLALYASWAVATDAVSSFTFYVADDATLGDELQVSVSSSNPSLIDPGSIVVGGTNNSRTLTVAPTNGVGAGTITVTVTDGSGLKTNFTIAVDVLEPRPVFIPDPNLELAVRTAVEKPSGDLTSVDLLALTWLSAFNGRITNLSGLEWATNLTSLDLFANAVTDLSPLALLNRLSWLILFGNQVTNLSPLAGLTNLSYVDLSSNPVTDLSFLTNLYVLNSLSLETNRLVDITSLGRLTNLNWLSLQQNRLADISALTNLPHLAYLDVRLNLLNVDTNVAIEALQSGGAFVVDIPQREPPIIDAHTGWLVAPQINSSLPFNVRDSGPVDEQVGAWIVSDSTDLVCQVQPVATQVNNSSWLVSVTPLQPPNGPLSQYVPTLYATNDVGLTNSTTVTVLVTALSPVTGSLLGDPGTVWTSGGDAPWFGQAIAQHDGHPVAMSGAVGNNQVSWLRTVVNGPGRLSFWWRVSSETNSDWLEFDVSGQTNRISGEGDWQYQIVDVPPGIQTLTWRYYKDAQGSSITDAGWLDEVNFQPLDPLADSDGDGLTNLVEYAVGTDLLNPTDANTGIIHFITGDGTNQYLAVQFKSRISAAAPQLQYLPEVSADKVNWYSDSAHALVVSVVTSDSTFNWVTVMDTTPITPAQPRFIRLHVISGGVESTSPIWVGTDTVIHGNGGSGSCITLFSQQMLTPILSAGIVSSINSFMISDTNSTFASGEFGTNGVPSYLEFDNGTMLDIANTAPPNVALAGSVAGIASVGDVYRIRAHSTVGSIFGTNNAAGLAAGPNPARADSVLLFIPETQRTVTLFYYSNPSFTSWQGWVRSDTFTPDPNEVVYPEQGIIVQRSVPGDINLYLCGPIRTGVAVVPVQPGYNLLGTLKSSSSTALSALNLFTGSLATGLMGGLNPSATDNLLVVNADGSVATFFYYYMPGVYQGWVNANGYALSDSVQIQPGTAFYIYRQAPGAFTWTIPRE